MAMTIQPPRLDTARLERDIPLAEALAMAGGDGGALEGYVFSGQQAAGLSLEGAELRGCLLTGCRLAGLRMDRIYLRDCVLKGCDLSGVHALDAALRRCELRDCKLSGANWITYSCPSSSSISRAASATAAVSLASRLFLGTYRNMDSSKASMAYSVWEVTKMMRIFGRKALICFGISMPLIPGISISRRIRS